MVGPIQSRVNIGCVSMTVTRGGGKGVSRFSRVRLPGPDTLRRGVENSKNFMEVIPNKVGAV